MFDPLAVMLVIAYNQALIDRNKKYRHPLVIIKNLGGSFGKCIKINHLEIVEDNERMDIIGQNGNDGLHYDLIDDEDVEEDIEPRDKNDPNHRQKNQKRKKCYQEVVEV